jgi:hypothetical protein
MGLTHLHLTQKIQVRVLTLDFRGLPEPGAASPYECQLVNFEKAIEEIKSLFPINLLLYIGKRSCASKDGNGCGS